MPDKFFIDSNVILYLLDKTPSIKKEIALTLIQQQGFISPQVIFECVSVCLRKLRLHIPVVLQFIQSVRTLSLLQEENDEVIRMALFLFEKYQFQPFDSKIVATALVSGCSILYSEDMHDGLVVENTLKIINPFSQKQPHQ